LASLSSTSVPALETFAAASSGRSTNASSGMSSSAPSSPAACNDRSRARAFAARPPAAAPAAALAPPPRERAGEGRGRAPCGSGAGDGRRGELHRVRECAHVADEFAEDYSPAYRSSRRSTMA
jgi:hypothetical protein